MPNSKLYLSKVQTSFNVNKTYNHDISFFEIKISDSYYTQEKKKKKKTKGDLKCAVNGGSKDPPLRHDNTHVEKYDDETCLPRGVGKLVREAKEREREEAKRNSFAGRKKRGR